MSVEKHSYSNGEVTVIWQPKLCQHSGNCIRGLPLVFNYQKHPWVNVTGATTDQIINQVQKCPSGALSFEINDDADADKEVS